MIPGLSCRWADLGDLDRVTCLFSRLFDGTDPGELRDIYREVLQEDEGGVFLLLDGERVLAGAHLAMRREYVEGSEAGEKTAYLEAIYVDESYRKQGLGRQLLDACQDRARASGCRLLASDCLLDNKDSLLFHLAAGFQEVSRNIHFIKILKESNR